MALLDVSGINEKFIIGIYYGAKDNFFCFFFGPEFDLASATGFLYHCADAVNRLLITRRIWLFYHITFIPEMSIMYEMCGFYR